VTAGAVLGYFWGDDGYGLDRAVDALAERLAAASGVDPERARVGGGETNPARIAERVATATLFGGGTLLTVTDPSPLLRSRADRDAVVEALGLVAPGNGLVFVESVDGSARRSATTDALRAAVAQAGGETRELRAPKEGQMAAWVESRARERDIRLGRGAAQAIAERVGAFVREGDVDRRRMGQIAVGELEKLALYRGEEPIEHEDVELLVAEVAPASAWAFLDAVAARRARQAGVLLDSLLESVPEPVILAQLHRRLRELIDMADRLDAGTSLQSIARELGYKEFRARKLAEQARAWTVDELIAALEGVLALDALVKGAEPASERQRRLAFQLWIMDRVARR
jgi:DNA polymerase III delta subunit